MPPPISFMTYSSTAWKGSLNRAVRPSKPSNFIQKLSCDRPISRVGCMFILGVRSSRTPCDRSSSREILLPYLLLSLSSYMSFAMFRFWGKGRSGETIDTHETWQLYASKRWTQWECVIGKRVTYRQTCDSSSRHWSRRKRCIEELISFVCAQRPVKILNVSI